MLITQPNLDALRVSFSDAFGASYTRAETQYQLMTTPMASSTKTNVYGWLAQQLVMREWIGPREAQTLAERSYAVTNKKFESTIEIPRTELADAGEGDLALYRDVQMSQLAVAAAEAPDARLVQVLQSTDILAFDGKAIFANDHPTKPPGATPVYDNLHALPLTTENVHTLWANGPSILGEDGVPQSIIYDTLIVPPQLYRPALEATQANQRIVENTGADAMTTIDNVMKGWLNVIMMPRLGNQATTWYMAKLGGPLKPFVFQDREPTEMVARTSLDDPKVFDQDIFTFGARRRFEIAPTLPFLIQKSVG